MELTVEQAKDELIDFLISKPATAENRKILNGFIKPYGKNYITAYGKKHYFAGYDAYANVYVFELTFPEDNETVLWSVGKEQGSLIQELAIDL
jgi:hypothetical protein